MASGSIRPCYHSNREDEHARVHPPPGEADAKTAKERSPLLQDFLAAGENPVATHPRQYPTSTPSGWDAWVRRPWNHYNTSPEQSGLMQYLEIKPYDPVY